MSNGSAMEVIHGIQKSTFYQDNVIPMKSSLFSGGALKLLWVLAGMLE